jgi:predicted nucleic acid-binding protein
MIFVDTNVFMYAVGRSHPLRDDARAFFEEHVSSGEALVSSAEVLQELMHAYLPVDRIATLDAALELARGRLAAIWSVDPEDVALARDLIESHPGLGARDLLHLACCKRRDVRWVKTFDRQLAAAFA